MVVVTKSATGWDGTSAVWGVFLVGRGWFREVFYGLRVVFGEALGGF